jgi:hypothetical protein
MKKTVIVLAVEQTHLHTVTINEELDKSQIDLIRDAVESAESIEEAVNFIHDCGFNDVEYSSDGKLESGHAEFRGYDTVNP